MRLSVPQLMPLIILRPMLPISRAFPSLNLETGRQWLTVVDSFRQGRQCDSVESGRQFSTVVDSGRQWLTEGSFRQLRQWSTVVDSSTVRSTASTASTVRAQIISIAGIFSERSTERERGWSAKSREAKTSTLLLQRVGR